MSSLGPIGFRPDLLHPQQPRTEHVMLQRPLQRVMAFRRRSIDDVVNDPIVKNEIYGYWKLYKHINRSIEIGELERQWNAVPAISV